MGNNNANSGRGGIGLSTFFLVCALIPFGQPRLGSSSSVGRSLGCCSRRFRRRIRRNRPSGASPPPRRRLPPPPKVQEVLPQLVQEFQSRPEVSTGSRSAAIAGPGSAASPVCCRAAAASSVRCRQALQQPTLPTVSRVTQPRAPLR
ncbi:unnamed protein product [Cuscuta epithymum]|uniref:Uncharacterized protein n=1 Tax=Cuscuta epithymum TaxID=186058 RepID=A0AAV0CXW1_9ASTE|nr:unnamed protein product [Cuscuta epithymum]